MRDANALPDALNPALIGSQQADEFTETPYPRLAASQFEFSIDFSPQTASSSGRRSPWTRLAAYTPRQLSHDGTSDNSSRLHSRSAFGTGLADNNTSLESSSKHTPQYTPQHTPQSTGQSFDCQDSISALESRDYDSLFLGLSEVQQTVDETSLTDVGFNSFLDIGQGGQVQYPAWPDNGDELFRDIVAPPYDYLNDQTSSVGYFDETLQAVPIRKEIAAPAYQNTPSVTPSEAELFEESPPKDLKRKRQRFGSVEREQVKQVRRQGACLRCRIYKEKVRTWSQTFRLVIDFT